MSTPVEQLGFTTTLASTTTSLENWSNQRFLNVKNFGALGDGTGDDSSAIQACFNQAFGSSGAPHGLSYELNTPVYFPPGIYNIGTGLTLTSVRRSQIIGSGSRCTTLRYTGTPTGGSSNSPIFIMQTNGFNNCTISGLGFAMPSSISVNGSTNFTIGLDYSWDNIVPVNTSVNLFRDLYCRNATFGIRIGEFFPVSGPSGPECDTDRWYNCTLENCYYGMSTRNYNALQHTVLNCEFKNCIQQGLLNAAGSFALVVGCKFTGTAGGPDPLDINSGNDNIVVIGSLSESANFAAIAAGYGYFIGCQHLATSSGYAGRATGPPNNAALVLDNCIVLSSQSVLYGQGDFFIRSGSPFINGGIANIIGGGGTGLHGLREWPSCDFVTVGSALTSSNVLTDGFRLSVSDSTTATWGAISSVGGGANRVSMRWNSANWTVVAK